MAIGLVFLGVPWEIQMDLVWSEVVAELEVDLPKCPVGLPQLCFPKATNARFVHGVTVALACLTEIGYNEAALVTVVEVTHCT